MQGRRLATFVMLCKTSEKTVPALTQGADSGLIKTVGAEETEELRCWVCWRLLGALSKEPRNKGGVRTSQFASKGGSHRALLHPDGTSSSSLKG